jgi:hypothetical protein
MRRPRRFLSRAATRFPVDRFVPRLLARGDAPVTNIVTYVPNHRKAAELLELVKKHQTPEVMAVWEPMGPVLEDMTICEVEQL